MASRYVARLVLATLASASTLIISGCGGGGGASSGADTTLSPPPAVTPSVGPVSGNVDAVDQQSVLGWACYSGDATTKVNVELWAIDTSTGSWTYITTAAADKQRTAVGKAGVCGIGLESNYHGFEFAVYPDNMLTRGKTYFVYAYHRPTGQVLAGGGRSVSFPESGLPTSGYWRTDFDDPTLRLPALLSCVWPFLGANQRGDTDDDPLWLDAAGGTWRYGPSAPLEFVTPSKWCITYDTVQANPPSSWLQSDSATNAPVWPTGNFWVVDASNEPAYSQLNSGPPGQSLPLNTGTVFSVNATDNVFVLGIDNTQLPKDADGKVIVSGGTPFLSIGSQMGRGTPGALAFVDANGVDTYLEFSATKNLEAGTVNPYHGMFLFVEGMWGRAKRTIVISLQSQVTKRLHWNWNVYPSFYYPGAELNFVSIDDIVLRCNLNSAAVQKMDGVQVGVTATYSIPLRGLFQCVDDNRVPGLGWTTPRPTSRPLLISGIHFSIEQGPQRPDNKMQVTYSMPKLVTK